MLLSAWSIVPAITAFIAHGIVARAGGGFVSRRANTVSLTGVLLGALLCLFLSPVLPIGRPDGILDLAALVVMWLATMAGIRAFLYAIDTPSPTLEIVSLVAAAGPQGLDPEILEREITDARYVIPRIEYLATSGMTRMRSDAQVLAGRGRLLLWVSRILQRGYAIDTTRIG